MGRGSGENGDRTSLPRRPSTCEEPAQSFGCHVPVSWFLGADERETDEVGKIGLKIEVDPVGEEAAVAHVPRLPADAVGEESRR